MKRLVHFELRKIMRRRIWMAILICLIPMAFYFADAYKGMLTGILTIQKDQPELVAPLVGPVDPALYKQYAPTLQEEDAEYSSEGTIEEKAEKIVQQRYASAGFRENQFQGFVNDLKEWKLALDTKETKGSYLYKAVDMQLTMMERIKAPGFYITRDWENLFLFVSDTAGSLFMGIILVLAISPLFSGETDYHMDSLILSSRLGRHRIVMAKVMAGFVFTVSWVTAFYTISLLAICLPFKFIGWNAPLNSYYLFAESPYALSQLQGFLLQYAMALLAACALMLLFALVSALMKSSISSMGVAVALIILPLVSFPGLLGKLLLLLPSRVMQSRTLIESFRSYNLFGQPVIYMTMAILVMVMVLLASVVLLPRTYALRLKG